MEKVTLNIELAKPYSKSVSTLYHLVGIWGFDLIRSDSDSKEAVIKMSLRSFIKIFHKVPKIGKYNIPSGTERFFESVYVSNIEKVEEND